MKRSYRTLGFVVSGALHLGVAAALIPGFSTEPGQAPRERSVPVSLAMFEPAPPARTEPPSPPQQPKPAAAPAPEAMPAPRPVAERPVTAQPRPEPQSAKRVARQTAPKPEPPTEPAPPVTAVPAPEPTAVVPATPATAPPAVVQSPDNAVLAPLRDAYLRTLQRRIEARKFYPRPSRRRREEGEVTVAFVLDRHGSLSELRIQRSSGSARLDEAALETCRRAGPFPPIPAELDRERWEIAVPLRFELRG